MDDPVPPDWQLPRGLTRGLWDYTHSDSIADDYDDYFAYCKLFEFDEALLHRHFTRPGLVVDLGCGTGRALIPLVRRGYRALAVDFSLPMLEIVAAKAREEHLAIDCLRANLVELDMLPDGIADYAICLFSTLGMIRGRENRRAALVHFRRILKPGGLLMLHVHNYWHQLLTGPGRRWLLGNVFRGVVRRDLEMGDKFFSYRGIPNMFLHVFRHGELSRDLAAAGLRARHWHWLDVRRHRELKRPWLAGGLRASGWIVVCEA